MIRGPRRPASVPLLLLALAAAALAGGDPRVPGGEGRFHNQPDPASSGGLTATISPADSLEEVLVVEPVEYKVYRAQIDSDGARFTVRGLPPGKYDLILKFPTAVVEGLRLDGPGRLREIPERDWEYIQWEIWRSNDFFHHKSIVRMGSDGERAKMLVEQVRTRKTHEPSGRVMKGLLIRRLELTELRKTGKVWQTRKVRHLYREERRMDAPGRRLKFIYAPKLGGIRVADEMVTLPHIEAKEIGVEPPDHFYSARHSERGGHHEKKMPSTD